MARFGRIVLCRKDNSKKRLKPNSFFQRWYATNLLFLIAGLIVLLLGVPAQAAQVTLAWNPNTEADLAGYKVYYGTTSRSYNMLIDVGKTTTHTVPGLSCGNTYYFAATAYNTSNLESDYSSEVIHRSCTYSISPPSASVARQGTTGAIQVTTQTGCPWNASIAASWFTITSGNQGTGNGTVSYSVTSNTGTSARTVASTIAGNLFTITQAGTETAPATTKQIWLEAESGSLRTPMVVASNAQASSGQYVWVPQGQADLWDPLQQGGTATYTFQIPQSGNYVIWGRVIANGDSHDSFFASLDSGTYGIWDLPWFGTEVWGWNRVSYRDVANPVVYSLTAGPHTFTVKQRENGTKLDRILITDDMAYVPQGSGTAVQSVPKITSVPVTSATVGQVYTYDVNATGEPVPTYTLTTYPPGMTINASTGLIQWTPTAVGQFAVTVQASNTQGPDTQNFVVTVNPESSSVQIWLEAESGSLRAPMVVASNAQASSGQYVWVPQGQADLWDPLQQGGTATYTFQIPQSGNYVIWGRVITNGDSHDSFFAFLDSGTYGIWDLPWFGTEVWGWNRVSYRDVANPVVYSLTAGPHTFTVKQRENGTKLDRILITDDMAYVP